LNFQVKSDENSLVPLPARQKRERPGDVFFMIKLFRNDMWEVLIIYL